jgi:cytidylate kinase
VSFVVTIDGPAAAGKSTTARAIARRLGWRYLDTGAFYRALGLKALRRAVPLTDAEAAAFARETTIEFSGDPDGPRLVLDGEDVTDAIRTPAASDAASRVAALPAVRRQLVEWQRALRAREPLVGEGRDLGTVVFPDAEVKLYLDADLDTRAGRRLRELRLQGTESEFDAVRDEIRVRDERDRSRADSPLRAATDATVLDTTGMDLERQVEAALAVIRSHRAFPGPVPAPGPSAAPGSIAEPGGQRGRGRA